jgi:hypothetical protein
MVISVGVVSALLGYFLIEARPDLVELPTKIGRRNFGLESFASLWVIASKSSHSISVTVVTLVPSAIVGELPKNLVSFHPTTPARRWLTATGLTAIVCQERMPFRPIHAGQDPRLLVAGAAVRKCDSQHQ